MNDVNANEDRLRAEIEQLRRQVDEQKALLEQHRRPSSGVLVLLGLLLIGVVAVGFFAGYLPRQKREQVLAAESRAGAETLPVVNVVRVSRSDAESSLVLPGNIQAVAEAPVLARASGYVKRRFADIGDRVAEGQSLAEIEAPELDQQIRQANAALDQANNAIQQAEAALKQGRSNENLARVTAQRYKDLFGMGVVSSQENDNHQAQLAAQQANVEALEKAVAVSRSNAGAVQANLARFTELKGYQTVRAPFAGVITMRNVDAGALVNEGSTLLFRIAQTGRLRTYVNLPQSESDSVRVGQQATLTIADLPGRKFAGTVTRTASALDAATRTMLVEIQVDNADGRLLPGMYAQLDLSIRRSHPSLTIPGDTLVIRANGPQVAVVRPDGAVHYTPIQLGRDYGDRLEVLSGVDEGQQLAVNPSDSVREGVKVKPVALPEKKRP